MNFVQFGVHNVKLDANRKRQELLETSLNLRCDVHGVGTSHGTSHQKQTSLHVPPTQIICPKDAIRNPRKPHRLSARTSHATETSHLARLR